MAKKQRPFNRPEDVTRMLQRLSRSPSIDWEKVSPIERAALLARADPAPAAYSYQHVLSLGDIALDYITVQLFGAPAHYNSSKDANETDYQAQIRNFWRSPVDAENVKAPLPSFGVEFGEDDFLRGWAFHARDIIIEYYRPANRPTRLARMIRTIRITQFDRTDPNGLWDPSAFGGYNHHRCGLLGIGGNFTAGYIQAFTHDGPSMPDPGAADELSVGILRDFPILPNNKFIFANFLDLVEGDAMVISMSGAWHFYPYYMGEGDEPRR